MKKWMEDKMLMLAAAIAVGLGKVEKTLADERGDTNFISILIVLGIVIIVAGVFIGFKDKIIEQVNTIVEGFTIQ